MYPLEFGPKQHRLISALKCFGLPSEPFLSPSKPGLRIHWGQMKAPALDIHHVKLAREKSFFCEIIDGSNADNAEGSTQLSIYTHSCYSTISYANFAGALSALAMNPYLNCLIKNLQANASYRLKPLFNQHSNFVRPKRQ